MSHFDAKGRVRRAAFITAAVVSVLALAGTANATPFPGPDAFGYQATTTGFNLRDISTSGTFLPLSDDQVSGAIPIGFGFDFYGITYNQLYVSSNGFLTFTPNFNPGCCNGGAIPSSIDNVNNIVAGYWTDLNLPQGNIRYQTLGSTGSREFVTEFANVAHYNNGPRVTFEMILHEGSNNIELQYGAAPDDASHTETVGIENAAGTIGLEIARGNLNFNNQGFLISTEDTTAPVPEPASMTLFGTGVLGLIARRRRRTQSDS